MCSNLNGSTIAIKQDLNITSVVCCLEGLNHLMITTYSKNSFLV